MYKRYVDDQVDTLPPVTAGWSYNIKLKKMEYSEFEARCDIDTPALRTAKVLQCIANSIEECIKVTFDVPEMNTTNMLPVLDLEVWVADNQVRHRFYQKTVSSEYTIINRSALSSSTKTSTTFMECYRRISNCSPDTPWSEIAHHMSKYMNCMRISGYSIEERYNTVKGAIHRYNQILDQVSTGSRQSMYRSGEEIRSKKAQAKCWSNTWFLKGDVTNTVSCPVTPGGALKKQLSNVINQGKTVKNIQVIEDGGKPIHCGLSVSDPKRVKGCIYNNDECMVNPQYRCDTIGVVYKIECKTCLEEIEDDLKTDSYVGMTRTSVHHRMEGHLKGQKAKKSSNPLYRHDTERHGGIPQKYTTSIVGREKKLVRLNCLEAILIEKQHPEFSINAKMEKGRGGVVRISAMRR